ncbi:sensor histidine kinase [Streptomyces cylindrosporus]|uniref:histidine kinase n=1 Tax=Streptomyces cylindrosporus TaxID=2927583 RepID=A0ABS9Y055_9ACTN|nr:ATP-binding protein [Streptomyces cylindrosporus]MCI3270592.1 ATP-binding protein [Streptomyces cylindrosporus]
MSHLRAPAARADRREGGRHGRPVARPVPSLPEAHIRPQLLRLAVLPPIAVALSAGAAVLFTVRSTGARPGLPLWGVLAGAVSVALAAIVIAAVAADRAAKAVSDRVGALRRRSARGEADLRALVDALRQGEAPPQRKPRGGPPEDADDFELLAADLARAHDGAVTAVVQAAQLSSQAGSEQKLEVFVNLARRLQSLVHREISILDELENEIEDPDLLKGLFHVDHLATRIRRHAENLAVLGGAVSRRQWSHPVSMTEVLRSAIAEVEQYSRVKLVPPIDGTLRGHAVADVIHLLAELVENATVFSAPHTQVLLRANLVTSGLAVEVEDRGLGMPVAEQKKMNTLLSDPDQVNVASLLADGRIGLFVVSQLARRHGINVRLQTNIYGGVQAVLVVPQGLLGSTPGVPGTAPQPQGVPGPPGQPRPQTAAGPGPETLSGRRVTPPPPAPRRGERWENARPATTPTPNAAMPGGTPLNGAARGGAAPNGAMRDGAVPGGAMPGGGVAAGGVRDGLAHGGPASDGGVQSSGMHSSHMQGGGGAADPAAPGVPVPGGTMSGGGGMPVGGGGGGAADGSRAADGGAPAPLPVRGHHEERANPAEALPGIRADDRRLVAEHSVTPPRPRTGPVRGTMGKPQLPRRRAQEHIAPQLRDGPAPRQDAEYPAAGHDPGLMAAFQRGIGLAEAQQHLEAEDALTSDTPAAHTRTAPMPPSVSMEPADMDRAHMGPGHMDRGHMEPTPMDPMDPMEPTHTGSLPRVPTPHLDALRTDVSATTPPHSMDVTPMDPAHIAEARPAAARGVDHPTRHDGSAPAG